MKFQSSVQANFILDVREGSVEGIRRIRNLEVRVTFEGEEKWKVALCALVGAPDSAMGVVPFACGFIRSFLCEEVTPFVMPELEPVCEARLVGLRKKAQECLQILPSFELRLPRDVAGHDLRLVEVAHLHRNAEGLKQATPAVTDDCQNMPSL